MAAPTNAAYVKKALANSEPRPIAARQYFGRYWVHSGHREALALSGVGR